MRITGKGGFCPILDRSLLNVCLPTGTKLKPKGSSFIFVFKFRAIKVCACPTPFTSHIKDYVK